MTLGFINKPINPPGPYRFTVISTFAGCGGSSLGYKWAGGKVLAAVEWEQNAVDTYRLNHQGTHVLHRDIATVTTEELLELTGLKRGELDIFDGSPPCQGFSTAGKRQIDDPRNQLFQEYVRLLTGLQPKVFVMENVSGMVKGKMKLVFVEILKELKAQGYRVSARLLNAKYFGVPQSRERMIFVGVRNDLGIEPSHPKAQTKPITVGAAIEGVPAYMLPFIPSEKSQEFSFYKRLRQGQGAQTLGKGNFGTIRLHAERPSITLRKTCAAGGFSHTIHPTEDRAISIGEMRRLFSFPDAFSFAGKYVHAHERIGNSVPPRFMQAIAEHIRDNILGT